MVRRACRVIGRPIYRVYLGLEAREHVREREEADEEVGERARRRLGARADREDAVVRQLLYRRRGERGLVFVALSEERRAYQSDRSAVEENGGRTR